MTAIPEDEITQADIQVWYRIADQLKKLKATESLMRKRIFKAFFKNPVEGTNSYDLGDGYTLKATYPTTRSVDEAAMSELKEQIVEAEVKFDKVFVTKFSLGKAAYNKLNEEQLLLVQQCLIEKPGSVGLSIEKNAEEE